MELPLVGLLPLPVKVGGSISLIRRVLTVGIATLSDVENLAVPLVVRPRLGFLHAPRRVVRHRPCLLQNHPRHRLLLKVGHRGSANVEVDPVRENDCRLPVLVPVLGHERAHRVRLLERWVQPGFGPQSSRFILLTDKQHVGRRDDNPPLDNAFNGRSLASARGPHPMQLLDRVVASRIERLPHVRR